MKNYLNFKCKSLKSQVAVIITLVLSFIILFSVIVVNIAQVGEIKNMTSKAADTAALKMASSFGSMAKCYTEYIDEGCNLDWIKLGIIVAAILAVLFLPSFGMGAVALISFSVFLGGGFSVTAFMKTITASRAIQAAIYDRFAGMSKYNGIREEALLSTLNSIQTDDTLVYNRNPGGGAVFYDDENNNGSFDGGERQFDLSGLKSADVTNSKYQGRFFAWYFTRRLPLVDEVQLVQDTEDFIIDLDKHIILDDWDPVRWIYNKAFLVSDGGLSAGKFIKTTSINPSWVFGVNRVTIVDIDESMLDASNRYIPMGFLKNVFDKLATDLEGDWPGSISFCDSILSWFATCDGINEVIEDLVDFIAKYKFVKEMPDSDRMGAITQWFTPQFYDVNHVHDEANGGSHDVYERLTRSAVEIQVWIDDLTALDNGVIRPTIASPQGECVEGQGALCCGMCDRTYACNTAECGCHYCDSMGCCCNFCCYNPGLCAYRGNYLTCCKNPPVCNNGDMYGDIPWWCVPVAHDPCDPKCPGCNVNNYDCGDDTSDYQGTLNYLCGGCPTEVGQAIDVLKALLDDIEEIKTIIRDFAGIVATYVSTSDPLRSAIDYAWKGRDNRNHYVTTTITNYPEVLPHVIETRSLGGLVRCLEYVGFTNFDPANSIDKPFIIYAGRYDQDMVTGWWRLRYRRSTDQPQFSVAQLNAVITEIANTGQLSVATKGGLFNLYQDYIISSQSAGYYGPEKAEIRIEKY